MSQINTYVALRPTAQVVQINELGERQPRQSDGWLSNSPIVKPGDVIVEPDKRRWRITAVQTTERRRSISRQILNVVEIERKNVEYLLPVEEVDEPIDTFMGFYPEKTPGPYSESVDRPKGSGLL